MFVCVCVSVELDEVSDVEQVCGSVRVERKYGETGLGRKRYGKCGWQTIKWLKEYKMETRRMELRFSEKGRE